MPADNARTRYRSLHDCVELIKKETVMRTCRELLRLLDADCVGPTEVPLLMSIGAAAIAAAGGCAYAVAG